MENKKRIICSSFQESFNNYLNSEFLSSIKNNQDEAVNVHIGKDNIEAWEAKFDPTIDIDNMFKRKRWNTPFKIVNIHRIANHQKRIQFVSHNMNSGLTIQSRTPITKRGTTVCFDHKATETLGDYQKCQKQPKILGLKIRNIKCSFHACCQLDLNKISKNFPHSKLMEYGKINGLKYLKFSMNYSNSYVTLHANGFVQCEGSKKTNTAKNAALRVLHYLKILGYKACFRRFNIDEVNSTVYFPWDIDVLKYANDYKYTVKLQSGPELEAQSCLEGTIKVSVFDTGAVNITTKFTQEVKYAIDRLYVLLFKYRKLRSSADNDVVLKLIPFGNQYGGFDLI